MAKLSANRYDERLNVRQSRELQEMPGSVASVAEGAEAVWAEGLLEPDGGARLTPLMLGLQSPSS